jgi:hypothetical protein
MPRLRVGIPDRPPRRACRRPRQSAPAVACGTGTVRACRCGNVERISLHVLLPASGGVRTRPAQCVLPCRGAPALPALEGGVMARPYLAGKGNGRYRHGGATGGPSPTYVSWTSMVTRCTNPSRNTWKDYGGRGITVCERWRAFDSFLADMGERPSGTSLDRIDPNGNYEPGNCRWADKKTQALNRRPLVRISAPRLDLTGKKAYRLTVIRFLRMSPKRHSVWLCRCDCGAETEVAGPSLSFGTTKSCGCLRREAIRRPRTPEARKRIAAGARQRWAKARAGA